MNNRIRLGLLLLTFSMPITVGTAKAQGLQHGSRHPPFRSLLTPTTKKRSHYDLPGEIDQSTAEEMMAQRLQELHELHQLQDQVQGLLQDRDFLDQIKTSFTESDLQKLRDKVLKGEGLSQDRNWKQLIENAASRQKWDERQLDSFRRLVERAEHKPPAPSATGLLESSGSDTPSPVANASNAQTPPPTPLPKTAAPEPSFIDRVQEGTTKWMMENLDSVGGDVVETLAELGMNEENAPFAELLRSVQQPDFSNLNIGEQTMGLSRYLSNAGDFLHRQRGTWDNMQSIFNKTPVPSLPNLGVPSASMPSAATSGVDSWVPTLLSLLLFGLVVLLLCLRSLGTKSQPGSGEGDGWRLGSWPVPPGRVSTRQDVVRAFEYLALLCLGPAAGACHHHELAERLADQDSSNPARRQAAEILAWLYEQARYSPAGDALSQEQLSDARHALCLLAGVTV